MSFARLLHQDVTLVFPGSRATDAGDTVPDWSSGAVTTVAEKGLLQQTDSVEITEDRDTIVSDWRLFLFPNSTVAPRIRVVVGDDTFRVVGRPALVERPPRGPHHYEVRLVSIAG